MSGAPAHISWSHKPIRLTLLVAASPLVDSPGVVCEQDPKTIRGSVSSVLKAARIGGGWFRGQDDGFFGFRRENSPVC